MKNFLTKTLTAICLLAVVLCFTACKQEINTTSDFTEINEKVESLESMIQSLSDKINALTTKDDEIKPYGDACYEKIKYIDKNAKDRDSVKGKDFKFAQKWIISEILQAGYTDIDYELQDFTFTYYDKQENTNEFTCEYTTDGKLYNKQKRNYIEDANGTYIKATVTSQNIIVTKPGKTNKTIIVGAHYDGDGTGDNGSGVSLILETIKLLKNVETEYTIKYIFFSAEELGCYGSSYYANNMTQKEIDNTLYMINIDSLVCGDFTYLYGGDQQEDLTVTKTEAFENAMKVAKSLNLEFKTNPWTVENPAPGYDTPDYVSPSTGDWSDHKGFKEVGITYLYMEATNWEIPGPYDEYDGYGETYLVGMLMNTKNDYLEYIEKYFPGRIQSHLNKFSVLLYALLTQDDYQK